MLAEANREIWLAFDTANAQRQAYRASELLAQRRLHHADRD